jgi:SOS-response transcriptional repressor LexA
VQPSFRARADWPPTTAHARSIGDVSVFSEVSMTGGIPVVDLQPKVTLYNQEDQPFFAVSSTTGFCTIRGMIDIPIGTRIKEQRLRVGLNQSELGRALGISPQAVQKWEDGKSSPRNNKLPELAAALSTSVRELIRGTALEGIAESDGKKDVSGGRVFPQRSARKSAPTDRSGLVPLISWEQAAEWGQKLTTENVEAEDWLRCPFDHGKEAFVAEVTGESNYEPTGRKSYAPGELVYVDPNKEPGNRSMVVVRVDREERATLKQLLMDEGGTRLLRTLNPNWPTHKAAPLPENARIIGVVLGKWVPE